MKGKKARRDAGGKVPDDPAPTKAGGSPHVFAELQKKKDGGGVKDLLPIEGMKTKMRLDRPGRKRGGRAGADLGPLSSAHRGR